MTAPVYESRSIDTNAEEGFSEAPIGNLEGRSITPDGGAPIQSAQETLDRPTLLSGYSSLVDKLIKTVDKLTTYLVSLSVVLLGASAMIASLALVVILII